MTIIQPTHFHVLMTEEEQKTIRECRDIIRGTLFKIHSYNCTNVSYKQEEDFTITIKELNKIADALDTLAFVNYMS